MNLTIIKQDITNMQKVIKTKEILLSGADSLGRGGGAVHPKNFGKVVQGVPFYFKNRAILGQILSQN